MSESEKKKRRLYRKNREKWIFFQSVIIAIITVAVLISALVANQLNQKYYIGYNESGSIDYDVYLKDNDFYDSPYLEKNQSYVASLIDKIITNFNYEIDMDTDDVNYRYSYFINSRLEIIDDTSGVEIFNPEYELISVENKSQSSSKRLTINEIVVLNYDEYNELANRFLAAYSLTDTTSHIVLTLKVEVLSDCDAFSGSSIDTYSSELRIPLTTKTVNIKMTSSVPKAEAKFIACTRGAGSEAFQTTAIVLGVVDVLMILLLVAFIYLTKTADITYTARVRKILSQYKSYIQRIKNLFDSRGYQVILVDTFDEMLEIRDTIQAPILMYENEDKTCTKFMIPTDSKLLYTYEIKIEGYTDPEPDPEPQSEPTTIVSPNITNLVRPVVKVVVNSGAKKSEPEIKTIVEDAEVEIESDEGDSPEVITTVAEDESSEDIAESDDCVPQEEADITGGNSEAEVDDEDDDILTSVIEGKTVTFRYRKSFKSRLIQSGDKIKDYYGAIRNKLLSYKGVKARTSWSFESFNNKRVQCAKMNIRGKRLLVYLNLDTEMYNAKKYHFRNVKDKVKFADVPMLLKVKSDRGLKYVLELIEEMMNVLGIPEGEKHEVDYDLPYRTTEQLIEDGLIKVIVPPGVVFDEKANTDKKSTEDVDNEIEELLASIPNADESLFGINAVNAIDVFKDKSKKQTHRFDPDENVVQRGDVVLIPARDEANDKDVVLEAEVARGNYTIDATTLERPLKKIIGVVKRKATHIFTTMIIPTEENEK